MHFRSGNFLYTHRTTLLLTRAGRNRHHTQSVVSSCGINSIHWGLHQSCMEDGQWFPSEFGDEIGRCASGPCHYANELPLSVNWRWISIGVDPINQRKLIEDWNSPLAGEWIFLSNGLNLLVLFIGPTIFSTCESFFHPTYIGPLSVYYHIPFNLSGRGEDYSLTHFKWEVSIKTEN